MPEQEPVKTFGDFTERWWTVYMIFIDLVTQLYEDFVKWLNTMAEWAEKSRAYDDEMMRESLRDMDRTLHPAA